MVKPFMEKEKNRKEICEEYMLSLGLVRLKLLVRHPSSSVQQEWRS